VVVPSLPEATPEMGSIPLPPGLSDSAGIPIIAPTPTTLSAPPLLNPPYLSNHMSAQAQDRLEPIKGFPLVAAAVAGLIAILGLQMRLARNLRDIRPE
jgi:hypothetical protein